MSKKFTIVKDDVNVNPDEKSRVHYIIEGKYNGYYFFAKTDNSHLSGYASDGIKKGSVYKLDVWRGEHPVGRDSVEGKGVHVSQDLVAGYYNKWELKPKAVKDKLAVNEIVKYLDSISGEKQSFKAMKTGGKLKGDIGKTGHQYGYTLSEYDEAGKKYGLFVSPSDFWKKENGVVYKDHLGRRQVITERDKDGIMGYYAYRTMIGVDLGSKLVPASAKKFAEKIYPLNEMHNVFKTGGIVDSIDMNVPLFIRMLEYAKEDAKSDVDLHRAAENAINKSKDAGTLTMDSYDDIVATKKTGGVKLNKKIKQATMKSRLANVKIINSEKAKKIQENILVLKEALESPATNQQVKDAIQKKIADFERQISAIS